MDNPPNLITFCNMQGDGHLLLYMVSFYLYLNPEAGYTLFFRNSYNMGDNCHI